MKVSLNTIRGMNERYSSAGDVAAIGLDELVEKIGAQLGGVDEVLAIGKKYQGIVIVKVVTCVQHPNADRLHVCTVDDGGVVPDVKRNEQGYVEVVCGAPNVREGLSVAWLPPGSTVPETVDKEPFVLSARELRGVVSNGMLASPKELALGDSHAGILEIDGDYAPGTDFADAFGLKDDVLIDIENKMFTHRPDCFGFLGIARELAGIQGMTYKSPEWYQMQAPIADPDGKQLPLSVRNELPAEVPRFSAITMRDVTVGPSPVWLQVELAKVGSRSINNIVDYTNFFMLETGQPLHAYDYDKVKALSNGGEASIVVRNPKPGEKIKLLNGKEVEPRAQAIMIATDKQLIGIGGVMGGADTEVDETTKNIIIEAASFDMYSIRRTSMTHGLFTDAVTRFNKGQSPLQTVAVLAKIVDEITRYADGHVASQLIDDHHVSDEALTRQSLYRPVTVTGEFINSRLGLSLSPSDMQALLQNVEFSVEVDGDSMSVSAPFWRTDIELREDVIEEIGRLYGYDKLPLELPVQDIAPTQKDSLFELKTKIRDNLSKAGANEVLTYSFVHGNLLDKVGQDKIKAFQIGNALSPDLQYFRLSLTPSLLDKVHPNIKAGYDNFALFELGKAHMHGQNDAHETDIPMELNTLSLVYANKKAEAGAPYYRARKYLDALIADFGVSNAVFIEPVRTANIQDSPWVAQLVAPYDQDRSAVVKDAKGRIYGVVGEFTLAVRRALKLPNYSAGFEVGPFLLAQASQGNSYQPLSRFPEVSQDVTLKLSAKTPYSELLGFVEAELNKVLPEHTLSALRPTSIYQHQDDPEHKKVTFRLTLTSYDRTLTDGEVSKLLDAVVAAAQTSLQAERV